MGSANGTFIGQQRLSPNVPFQYDMKKPIRLGTCTEILTLENILGDYTDPKQLIIKPELDKQPEEQSYNFDEVLDHDTGGYRVESSGFQDVDGQDMSINEETEQKEALSIKDSIPRPHPQPQPQSQVEIPQADDGLKDKYEKLAVREKQLDERMGLLQVRERQFIEDKANFEKYKKQFLKNMKAHEDSRPAMEQTSESAKEELEKLQHEIRKMRAETEASKAEAKLEIIQLQVDVKKAYSEKVIIESELKVLTAEKKSFDEEMRNSTDALNELKVRKHDVFRQKNRLVKEVLEIEQQVKQFKNEYEKEHDKQKEITKATQEVNSKYNAAQEMLQAKMTEVEQTKTKLALELRGIRAQAQAEEADAKLKLMRIEADCEEKKLEATKYEAQLRDLKQETKADEVPTQQMEWKPQKKYTLKERPTEEYGNVEDITIKRDKGRKVSNE